MPFVHATDGTRIHYEVTGKSGATPVLMIQGLGASKNAWNLQRIAMATRFRIISFDNRGAGRSDKPTEPFTLEQMADDALAVLDAAGIESAHVVELLSNGRLASNESMLHMLNFEPLHTTKQVLTRLYEWPSVIRIQPTRKVA